MGDHRATIDWSGTATEPDFVAGKYSREHTWTFDGGAVVAASSSPQVVRAPWANPANVDPEEALVAAISSCHMLTFLYLASRARFAVTAYRDEAVGVMTKNERGVPWVSHVTLAPRITYAGRAPTADEEAHLHHEAHEQCFIAQSVKTEIVVAPQR
jgi:organic hydroperoxide reductase OsmC/OhrA